MRLLGKWLPGDKRLILAKQWTSNLRSGLENGKSCQGHPSFLLLTSSQNIARKLALRHFDIVCRFYPMIKHFERDFELRLKPYWASFGSSETYFGLF